MKRAVLFATVTTCVISLTVNTRSGAAEQTTPVLRVPQAIAIEVFIVDTKGGLNDEQLVPRAGPTGDVTARLRELESKGHITGIEHIWLTAVENEETRVQVGTTTPIATGRSLGGRGGAAAMSYEFQHLGTQLSAIAKVDGGAIVLELNVEKSHLESHAGKPQPDDTFVPLGTETLSSRVTVRIGSGETIVAGGLEKRVDAGSSGQLILVSACLLDTSSGANAAIPAVVANTRQIRIFWLQNAAAEEVAAVIKGLFGHDPDQIRVGIDPRTNSLVISAEKRQLDAMEAILLQLDESGARRVSEVPTEEEKSALTPDLNRYEKMAKQELQEELKKLQQEVLGAEAAARRAKAKSTEAARAFNSASDEEKPDALLRMIEADAASREPVERFQRICSDFDLAKQAYLELLLAE